MRFKCHIKDVNALLPTLQAFLFSSNLCLLVLSPEVTRIIVPADHTSGEQLYAELATDVWAEEYKIESQHENKIPLLVYIPNLIKTLKSCEKAELSVLKLTKRNQRAFLTCDTCTGDTRVVQDLPIIVQSVKKVDDWEEPVLDAPRVKIVMPDLKALAALTDKMKNFADVIDIEATSEGVMTLTATHGMLTINSRYDGLKINQPSHGTPVSVHSESPALHPMAQVLQAEARRNNQQQQQPPYQQPQPQQQPPYQQPQPQHQQQPHDPNGVAAMELDGAPNVALPVTPLPPVAPSPGGLSDNGMGPAVPLSALNSAMDGTPRMEPVERATARVAMKKFINVTGAKNIQAMHCIACIVENGAFVVYIKLKNKRGIITYYLPLIQD